MISLIRNYFGFANYVMPHSLFKQTFANLGQSPTWLVGDRLHLAFHLHLAFN